METALLIAAILVAGLACPAVMWWQRRRGRATACLPAKEEATGHTEELEELRRRQAVISVRLAELQGRRSEPVAGTGRDPAADG